MTPKNGVIFAKQLALGVFFADPLFSGGNFCGTHILQKRDLDRTVEFGRVKSIFGRNDFFRKIGNTH